MKTTPLVTIDIDEYNRLMELDRQSQAGESKSSMEFNQMVHDLANSLEQMNPTMNMISTHQIARHIRGHLKK